MTQQIDRKLFLLFFLPLCIFLASCTGKEVQIIASENQKVSVKTLHPPTERILTCLDQSLNLPKEQLEQDFIKAKQEFSKDRTNEKRLKLICLSLARQDATNSLEYAQELIDDMQNIQPAPYPDLKDLAALLNYFEHLQQKRVSEVNKAKEQVKQLKQQLEELKSIEKIISDRKNDN